MQETLRQRFSEDGTIKVEKLLDAEMMATCRAHYDWSVANPGPFAFNIFDGNVVLTKGTMRVLADRIVVRQDAEGFQYATATGKPVRFRQRQDPRPPEKEGVWVDGEALRIEIDEKAGTVKLFENARVNRGGDEVAGNYILVDQTSEFFSVSAGKDGDQRVKMTIQPKPPAKPEASPPQKK